jgi:hypothetical protein
MKNKMLFSSILVAIIIAITFSGCKKEDNGPKKYSVGGTVQGLTGSGLILQNNNTDDLSISSDGPFTFPTKLEDSSEYDVSIENYPAGQTCYIENGSGTIDGSNVTDITVVCQMSAVTGSCSDGSIFYNHNVTNSYSGFQQHVIVTGSVPFTCDNEGNINGSAILSITVSGSVTAPCTEITYSGVATMHVTLTGSIIGAQVVFNVDEIWYVGSPTVSGTATNTCSQESETIQYPLPEVPNNYILTFPNINGYTITQPYIGESGSGSYNWTLYIN